jgi:hypothetical protein
MIRRGHATRLRATEPATPPGPAESLTADQSKDMTTGDRTARSSGATSSSSRRSLLSRRTADP